MKKEADAGTPREVREGGRTGRGAGSHVVPRARACCPHSPPPAAVPAQTQPLLPCKRDTDHTSACLHLREVLREPSLWAFTPGVHLSCSALCSGRQGRGPPMSLSGWALVSGETTSMTPTRSWGCGGHRALERAPGATSRFPRAHRFRSPRVPRTRPSLESGRGQGTLNPGSTQAAAGCSGSDPRPPALRVGHTCHPGLGTSLWVEGQPEMAQSPWPPAAVAAAGAGVRGPHSPARLQFLFAGAESKLNPELYQLLPLQTQAG